MNNINFYQSDDVMTEQKKCTNTIYVQVEVENNTGAYQAMQLVKACLDLPDITKITFVQTKTNYCLFSNPSISFTNIAPDKLTRYNKW